MPDILSAYTWVTGRMPAPPVWSLGFHHCRWHPYDAAAVLDLADQYRRRAVPCDVLWLDIDYMDGFRVFTWNTSRYPDPEGLVATLGDKRLRLITIIDPGVKAEPGYAVFDEGRDKNLFCKTESGRLYIGHVWPGRTVFPDFVKPEARAFWGRLNAEHVARGISGIWNDMNEPATGGIDPFAMRFDRDGQNWPHERYHNQYALLMAMGTREGLLAARPDERPFILSRAGFAGIQRVSAQWMGDNTSSWAHLAMSVPMAAGLGISGQPFVGADIPGFGGRPTGELMVRWMQQGALTPFCRVHNCAGMPDQYPWSFGKGVENLCREAIELRYRLLPYLYATFLLASETGAPVQRPLVYHYQGDRQAREAEDQYLLGDALLVAAILEEGRTQRNVYLPEGTWVDWHTHETLRGGRWLTAQAPIDRIPLYARGGAVIPMLAEAPLSTMGHRPASIDLLVVVAEEDGEWTSVLHEDDGTTYAFQRGAFLRTTIVLARQGKRVSISARTEGGGFPEHERKRLRLVFANCEPKDVEIDGERVPVTDRHAAFDNAGRGFRAVIDL
jgi:alpha-glucosidase